MLDGYDGVFRLWIPAYQALAEEPMYMFVTSNSQHVQQGIRDETDS